MRLIFWGGIVFFIGSVLLLINNYKDIQIERNGVIVKMRIEKLPVSCLGTRVKHFATFSYNGENYIKRIPAGYCDQHTVGELIDMRYLESSSSILFPNESVMSNLTAFGILGLLGIGMLFYYWIKNK